MSSQPFATQLSLAQIHPQLAPLCVVPGGYALDVTVSRGWFALPPARGLAGYGLSRALRILLDVLAGVAALHATVTERGVGFVHGELAPSSVRVDAQGVARLLPLAPWHWQVAELPPSPESLGHLAPERLLGDVIDRRADVFSAGVLLWEALAGSRLFEHDSPDGIVTRLMGGKVLLPELPPELAWAIPLKAVAMRALAVDPGQRFADCVELERAIEAVARGHLASHAEVVAFFQTPARSVSVSDEKFRSSHKSSLSALVTMTAPLAAPVSERDLQSASTPRRARRATWAVTAAVSLVAALGVGAFARYNQTRAPAPAAERGAAIAVAPLASAPLVALEPSAAAAAATPTSELAPSASASAVVAPTVTPLSDARVGARVAPAARDSKGRAAPKAARAVPPAKPAAAKPRIRDNEAEQYGI
ncbi:MAG TPA: hypothetical protein VK745_12095 [Polyangiaceae bacterium]|nr:hypothetical protein [Polyangiaceae bacterium]